MKLHKSGKVQYIQQNALIPTKGKRFHRFLKKRYGSILAASRALNVSTPTLYWHIKRGNFPVWAKNGEGL